MPDLHADVVTIQRLDSRLCRLVLTRMELLGQLAYEGDVHRLLHGSPSLQVWLDIPTLQLQGDLDRSRQIMHAYVPLLETGATDSAVGLL